MVFAHSVTLRVLRAVDGNEEMHEIEVPHFHERLLRKFKMTSGNKDMPSVSGFAELLNSSLSLVEYIASATSGNMSEKM